MNGKNAPVAGYTIEGLEQIRTACLTVAAALGDLMESDITIVGGLAPSLLVDQTALPEGAEAHPGTLDLDLALALAVLDDEAYMEVSKRLRKVGFEPDRNANGNRTVQRWVTDRPARVTVDFLIAPPPGGHSKRVLNLEGDFGAHVIPGIDLAFTDRERRTVNGIDARGDRLSRRVWVCGPGALVVLKALACKGRNEPKDAFDLFYVLRNYGTGPVSVAERLHSVRDHRSVRDAMEILAADFSDVASTGPRRVGRFLGSDGDERLLAEVVAFVGEFIRAMGSGIHGIRE